MGPNHDLFSSGAAKWTVTASGTFINGIAGGTGAPVYAGNHEYHAVAFMGTIANDGTIVVYGHTASTGDGTAQLGSVAVGSGNGIAAFDFKADTLLGLGTSYVYYSALAHVPSGGTWRGALVLIDYNALNAGTTPAANGVSTLGTLYT